ncbi:hypothetical protein NDU88_000784 [Pleurodeles waltl]|uniref:Uncharacterized protein n=1 Tax=Pleurodeles waltl TaxID=8319 RepID=A0AAV7KQB9_PLEWA|nr:hypothetical protein NDU88_000784 [Pleurodeles waltl]
MSCSTEGKKNEGLDDTVIVEIMACRFFGGSVLSCWSRGTCVKRAFSKDLQPEAEGFQSMKLQRHGSRELHWLIQIVSEERAKHHAPQGNSWEGC